QQQHLITITRDKPLPHPPSLLTCPDRLTRQPHIPRQGAIDRHETVTIATELSLRPRTARPEAAGGGHQTPRALTPRSPVIADRPRTAARPPPELNATRANPATSATRRPRHPSATTRAPHGKIPWCIQGPSCWACPLRARRSARTIRLRVSRGSMRSSK